jgi:PEGA domain-containing protein
MRIVWSFLFAATIVLPLSAQPGANGSLVAKVKPGRAGVFVDGKYMGPAANFRVARTYSLPAGTHELKLVDPRYQEFVSQVNITAGKKTVVHETLTPVPLAKPPFGRLRTVSTDKFAAVYVNERFCGHADEFSNFAQGLLLNPGEYDVKIVPATGTPVTAKVKIEADEVTVVR